MASGLLISYLGAGPAASRPVAPDLFPGSLGLWLSTDTGDFDAWSGSAWVNITTAGASAVTSVNGQTGSVQLGLEDLVDVVLPSGMPSDQSILVYDSLSGVWVELPPGAPGDVLTVSTGGLQYEPPAGGGAVSSVNGQTGAVSLSLEDLDDVMAGTGTPDDGDVITYRGGVWVGEQPHGDGTDVDASGFRGVPQNAQTGNYTTVAADAGKHIYHASGAGAGDTYTIDSNANVPYEIGTAITFVNMDSNSVTIAIASDTLYLAGSGSTGSRGLAQYGIATAVKLTSTTWIISGSGLS